MHRILCLLFCCLLLGSGAASAVTAPSADGAAPSATVEAGAASPNTPLLVGVVDAPPFAYKDDQGEWTGIAVQLWRDIMAHHERRFTLQEMDLHTLLQALEQGRIDAGVTALSITSGREKHMDFSYPYFDTNLAVAVPHKAAYGVFLNVLSEIFSLDFLLFVAVMLAFALVAGCVIWLIERRFNPEQFRCGPKGVLDGIWWACVTMTTVGYGDAAPKTVPARLLAMLWMLVCVVLVAIFTASITTTLTVNRIGGKIASVDDLVTVHVGCLADSVAEEFLQHLQARPKTYSGLDAALEDLRAGKLDAVLHDRPLLQYARVQGQAKNIVILPMVVEKDDYGFAFPAQSPLRKQVNVELLRLRADRGYWETLTSRFLGS